MRHRTRFVGLFVIIAVLLTAFAGARFTRGAGEPIYPDLRTLPPANLSIQTMQMDDNQTHYLLRFDNTVGNWGGPLEIVANLQESRDLFQNVYDAYSGGTLVSHTRVDSDLIFHPTHNHFHFQDFASYALLKKDGQGVYQPTSRVGTKTSFCIVDSVRVAQIGSGTSSFNTCTASRQGLSAGWGDVYSAGLPDQWIDLGTSQPADGDYGLQSTANPKQKLFESNYLNNVAVTSFSIRNGRLTTVNTTPACTLGPNNGPVGTAVRLSCVRMTPDDVLDLRWADQSNPILDTITVDEGGEATASLVIPDSPLGPHYVYAISRTTQQATLALFTTNPAIQLDGSAGVVGSTLGFAMTGFATQERVTVRYTLSGTATKLLATLYADARGSVSGAGVVPVSALGGHKIEAKGNTSKKAVTSTFDVIPSLALKPTTTSPGRKIATTLRGFKRGEKVNISLSGVGTVLKTIRTSSTGSANGSSTNGFAVPKDLAPGQYVVQAVGTTSGATATAILLVSSLPGASSASHEDPTRTASIQKAAATATTAPPEPTPTATPTLEPTATATVDAPSIAEDEAGAEPAQNAGGTPET